MSSSISTRATTCSALTRLGAAQDFDRVAHHAVEAELLKGGLYLSLGEHEEAGRIFKRTAQRQRAARRRAIAPGSTSRRSGTSATICSRPRRRLRSIRGALPGDLEAGASSARSAGADVPRSLRRRDPRTRALAAGRRRRMLVGVCALQHRRRAGAQGPPRRRGEAARRASARSTADRGAAQRCATRRISRSATRG